MFDRIFFIDTYRLARLSPTNTGLEQDVFLYSHGYGQGSRAYVLVRKRRNDKSFIYMPWEYL